MSVDNLTAQPSKVIRIAGTEITILGTAHVSKESVEEVREVVDTRSLFSPAMLELTEWIADHYLCDWGQVLDAVVPAAGAVMTTAGAD